MADLAPFVALGLASGAMYGLMGLGLVLTYRTSGMFNFAHGAVAAIGAFAFYQVRDLWGAPWPVALVAAVGVVAPVAGLALERVARHLQRATVAGRIVATVGLLVGVQGALSLRYGASAIDLDPFLSRRTLHLGSIAIGVDQLIILGVATAGAASLTVLLHRTRLGAAMEAVVEDPDLVALQGISAARVRRWSWVIGSAFAAVSGILLAPSIGLDTMLLTLLVVQAFGAAALGRFRSLPGTYVGGLVIGVVAAVATNYVTDVPALAGLPGSLPFLALFVVLVTARRGSMPEAAAEAQDRAGPAVPALRGHLIRGASIVVALGVVPFVLSDRVFTYTNLLTQILVLASLRLLVRTSGQISLCHLSLVAVGATTFSHLTEGMHLPWGLALVGAGLATVPVGFIVSIPAIRLSRLSLALSTFAFALLLERLMFPRGIMFGTTGTRSAPRPGWEAVVGDRAFYFVVLAVVVGGVAVVAALERGRLGRLLRGLADSPTALAGSGLSVDTTRTIAFCLASMFAGVAGALQLSVVGTVSSTGFGVFGSLTLLVVLYLSGTDAVVAPVVGAAAMVLIPSYVTSGSISEILQVVWGFSAVAAVTFRPRPGAIAARLKESAATSAHRRDRSPVSARAGDARGSAAWTG